MAEIELGTETQCPDPPGGWSYPVTVFSEGRTYRYRITLSYQDYDFWSRGRVGPSRVVKAVVCYLLDNEAPDDIMEKFDCSVVRRFFPAIDKDLPGRL